MTRVPLNMFRSGGLFRALAAFVLGCSFARADVVVVFDEIMYHPAAPDSATEEAREWIEFHNQMAVDIDVGGWSLVGGVNFKFPKGTIASAGGRFVVAANPAALQAATGFTGAYGPWIGHLANDGEKVELLNRDGRVMDSLSYGTDGAWPSGPDGGGPSLSKRAENLDSASPDSWRSSLKVGGTIGAENFPAFQPPVVTSVLSPNGPWLYRSDGADLGTAWKEPAASEEGWASGNAAFQLGNATLPAPATTGTALPAGPVTYYFRRKFDYAGQSAYTQLTLRLLVDDGAAAYLNGTQIARVNLPATALSSTPASNPRRGAPTWQEFSLPAALLLPVGNVIAVEVHQAAALPSYPAAVLASGPVAYWRLDENSTEASALADLANLPGSPEQGNQAGGWQGFAVANLATPGPRPSDTVGGQPLLGFDATNAAPTFQGNNDGGNDVGLFPDGSPLNFATSGNKFSAEAWVKGAATQESGAAIIAKGNGGGGEQFCVDIVSNRFRFFVRDPATTVAAFQHGSLGPNNTWQHVAVTYDSATSTMRMYVNGVDVGGTTPRPTLLNVSNDVSVGARRLSNGAYDLNFDGKVDEVALFNRALSASEVAQHYAAAFAASPTGTDTTDAVFAAELIATETLPTNTPPVFLMNEISTAGVEIVNPGSAASTAGLTLLRVTSAGSTSIPIPAQSVAAGGLLQIALSLNAGDRILLIGTDGATVLDSFEVKSTPRSRSPDGGGDWYRPVSLTPGSPNFVALRNEVVINEIMFDPPTSAYFAPGAARAGQWIELRNKSTQAVSLDGWKFAEGVSFNFPANATLPPGGFLVVAESPQAVMTVHNLPASQVFGPWTGDLSQSGEKLRLEDAAGNPADEVRYAGGGRWPEYSDGGGSSLELVDANADNTSPEAWTASDESGKAAWQTFTWRAANVPSQNGEPTLWHELNLLLVDGPGECLIDDVRVTDTVTSANLIQNGAFDSGASKWRFLGNHRTSRVEAEPGNSGNAVLHLIASGAGEYQGNQIETTFVGNQTLVANREYEISLRARWLGGGGRLNTRLYFNRLPRTQVLSVAPNGGTPGVSNSRAIANLGPTYAKLSHQPVIPNANQLVTVSVQASDPDGIAAMNLKYSVAGGSWQTVPMTSSDNVHFSAAVPGQSAASIVQFYVEGRDGPGAVTTFPARGTSSRALFVVQDGQATGVLPGFRLVMTPADANFLHAPINTLSNELLGATIITRERDVYYDVGVRLKGSFVGRNVARVGFSVRFGPDQLFRGVLDKVGVDRSQGVPLGVAEIIAKHVATAAGGVPGMYDDLARFIHPLGSYTSTAALRLAGFDEEFLDSQYTNGSDGQMFEFEVIRWNLATIDGNPESPKLPGNEGSGTGYANLEIQDYGNDKEAYRWTALQVMHRDDDNYAGLIALEKLFSQSGATFASNAAQQLDVDEWLRTLALQSLVGPADAAYTGGNIHNFRLYLRPNDGKAVYLPWDWDSSFQISTSAALIGGGNLAKTVTSSADFTRRYQAHLYNLIQSAFNTTYMSRWTQHYGTLAGQDFSGILSFIGNRAAFVLGQLPTSTAFTSGNGAVAADGTVVITGTSNIAVVLIEVNGQLYTPIWTSATGWRIVVYLAPGSNTLTIRGIDANGAFVTGASSTLTITNPFSPAVPALRINEWLAENDGAYFDPSGESDDWFEIYNGTAAPLNLSGYRLTNMPGLGTAFPIPNGWSIPAGGFLLVWADNQPAQNPPSPVAGSALHVPFKLSKGGDSIQLRAPSGQPVDTVTFGPQSSNRTEGRFPDGSDAIRVLTIPSPGASNVVTIVAPPAFDGNSTSVQLTTTPGFKYTLQRSPDLVTWQNVEPAQVAAGQQLTISDPLPRTGQRFYRVLVVP